MDVYSVTVVDNVGDIHLHEVFAEEQTALDFYITNEREWDSNIFKVSYGINEVK